MVEEMRAGKVVAETTKDFTAIGQAVQNVLLIDAVIRRLVFRFVPAVKNNHPVPLPVNFRIICVLVWNQQLSVTVIIYLFICECPLMKICVSDILKFIEVDSL